MAKILLVDDSEPNRDMLARRLARRGHLVIEAGDGQRAVEMARAESPDLVLMDLNLPVLDGWSATRQIKASPEAAAVPVIALTAHAMSGDRHKAMAAGCDDYDTKPIDFPRLLGKIDALLKGPEAPPQARPGGGDHAGKDSHADDARHRADATARDAKSAGRVLVVDDTEANRHVSGRWPSREPSAR